jgi:methylglyoxal synthase
MVLCTPLVLPALVSSLEKEAVMDSQQYIEPYAQGLRSDGCSSDAAIVQSISIALVAHDRKKSDLLEWAHYNRHTLGNHRIMATGTTGRLLEESLHMPVSKLQSGPLGGDQQIGAHIAEGGVDCLIFFWDPLESQPHDADVRALLRLAVTWNIPVACNRASADLLISSPLLHSGYQRCAPDFTSYQNRRIAATFAREGSD